MGSFGKNTMSKFSFGSSVRASSIPEGVRSGVIDWNLIPAVSEDTTFYDNVEVKAGEKCLRYGNVLIRITSEGTSKNMFAIYDPEATDGRQRLERNNTFILDETICESDSDTNPQLFDKGSVFKERLLVGGDNQPTWEDFNRAFPQVSFISD